MEKLSKTEFADALKKGKGRAFIHVRDHGDAGIESELFHACLHSLSYDHQCEGNRGSWMMDFIPYTKSPDSYYHAIISNFMPTTEFWDVSQLSTMITLLAKRDYPGAKDVLYKKFDLQEFEQSALIGPDLIELDGIKGMLHIAEVIGKEIQNDSDYWENNYLTNWVCEPLGKEKTAEALHEAAKNNPSIKAYVDNVTATSGCLFSNDEENKTLSAVIPLQEFLSELEKNLKRTTKFYCFRFGRNAAPQDIQHIFTLLAAEKDREKLLRYLWVLSKVELPEVSKVILALAESSDEELRNAALRALTNIKNKTVRDLALNLLNDGNLETIKLFEKNYVEGDLQHILEKLHINDDADKIHRYGMDMLSICNTHNNAEVFNCLIWLYENTPCAMCRNNTVGKLIAIDRLPQVLAEECLCDCYEHTRKEVATFVQS